MFTIEDARDAAKELRVEEEVEDYYSYQQFAAGINVELEHGRVDAKTNVTDDDMLDSARIALAHLREADTYYYHLKRMERRAKRDNDILLSEEERRRKHREEKKKTKKKEKKHSK